MKPTYSPGRRFSSVEPLEARIAPASVTRFSAGQLGSTLDIEYDDTPGTADDDVFIDTDENPLDPISAIVGPGAYYMKMTTGDVLQLVNEASISPLISGDIRGDAGLKGNLIAFFVDKNGDNEVQANELVGLSLGDKVDVVISGTVDGDVLTNLDDSSRTLNATSLLNNATGKLSIAGDVTGSLVSGGAISGVNVTGRVTNVLAGTAANGYVYDLNGVNPDGGDTISVTVGVKDKGASITNSSFGNVTLIKAGDGGAGGVGGAISSITLRGDRDGFTIEAGNGGDGTGAFSNGGAGGSVSNVLVNGITGTAADPTLNDQIVLRAGAGGDAFASGNGGKGGAGGSVQNLYVSYEGAAGQKSPTLSATPLGDAVLVEAGAGGDGRKAGGGGSLRDVNVFAAPGGLGNDIELIAGAGGSSNVSANAKAGNGGAILDAFVLNSNVSQEAGLEGPEAKIILRGGAGGAAETGKGGNGGSINSPELTGFAMDLGAGSGGAGSKKAGNGGSLQGALLSDGGLSARPEDVVLNAGAGGSSTVGKAGNGGSINSFRILNSDLEVLSINTAVGAANGGTGGKGAGGKGGSVSQFEISESDTGNGGLATIRAGHGGNGGTGNGGLGGNVSSFTLFATQLDLAVTSGDGGDAGGKGGGGKAGGVNDFYFSSYRQDGGTDVTASFTTGSGGDGIGKKAGGAGGDVKSININLGREQSVLRDGTLVSLVDGGAITVAGGNGGNSEQGAAGGGGSVLNSQFLTYAGSIGIAAGDAGLEGGKAGRGGRIESASLDLLTSLSLTAGDGRAGGAGGDIKNIAFSRAVEDASIENFEATILATFGGSPLGSVNMIAGNGSGPAKSGGAGGSILDVAGYVGAGALEGDKMSQFHAGNGGDGEKKAGAGGGVNGLSLFGGGGADAEVRIVAGNAGDASSGKKGAAGGSVVNVGIGVNVYDPSHLADDDLIENPDNAYAVAPGTIIRHVAGGDGGDATKTGGNGGSILGLNTNYDIGVRSGEGFGFSTMGGIFAGLAGNNGASPGSVINVTANAISAIIAGKLEVGDTVQQANLANVVDRIILNGLNNPTRTDAVGNFANLDTANVLGGIVTPVDPAGVPYFDNNPETDDPVMHPHANTFDLVNGEFAETEGSPSADGVFGIGDTITAKTDGFIAARDFIDNQTNVRAEAVLTFNENDQVVFIDLNNTNGQALVANA